MQPALCGVLNKMQSRLKCAESVFLSWTEMLMDKNQNFENVRKLLVLNVLGDYVENVSSQPAINFNVKSQWVELRCCKVSGWS